MSSGDASRRESARPTPVDAAAALCAADAHGDEDWTYAVALEIRDQLRANLPRDTGLAAEWGVRPTGLEGRWLVLLAAFTAHEFEAADLAAPAWTTDAWLEVPWVLDTPRLTGDEIRAQTPPWLAARNIFIATKDLGTL